jgi:threonine dehydrogenase-like Zn-dependent dehydrogenase
VGLSAVISARLVGVEQIILMGRHRNRMDLGRDFGATDVVAERGDEGVARVRELTGGEGTRKVLECVGLKEALVQGGVAPARAYIEELVPHILDGTIRPGRVFDRTVSLEDIADGYRAMNDRDALKVPIHP